MTTFEWAVVLLLGVIAAGVWALVVCLDTHLDDIKWRRCE